MNGINNSQIQEVRQLIGNNIYLSDKIPIGNIQGVKLTANFWKIFIIYSVFSFLWIVFYSKIFYTTNIFLENIIVFAPIIIFLVLSLRFIEKKYSLQITQNYIKYRKEKYSIDKIFHIFQHPIIKSKVIIYYQREDGYLSVMKFILRNEAEAYYLVRKVEEYKIQKQFLKEKK